MIVTCERCTTQFQLDDSRVPEDGVRVRCSRCKHAFRVEPPARNELDKIQRIARRALEESEEGPDITQDLAPSSAVAPAQEFLPDDEESDWEFNEGVPAAAPELDLSAQSAAESAVDALLGAHADEAPSLEEPGGVFGEEDDGEGLDLGAPPGGDALLADPTPEDSLDLAAEEPALEIAAPVLASAPTAPEASDSTPAAPEAQTPLGMAEESASAADSGSDELGSPTEWDIFDEPTPLPEAAPVVSAPPPFVEERRVAPAAEVLDDEGEGSVWLFRIGAGVGWALTAALCAAGLALGLVPRAPAASSGAVVELAGLGIEDLSTRWIDNLHRGPLYVVSGTLRARGKTPRSADSLFLVLRDGSGRPVGERAPLGPALAPPLLRQADLAGIRSAQAERGAPLTSAAVPSVGMRFDAVVWPVPDSAKRFEFQAVEAEAVSPAEASEVPAPAASGPEGATQEAAAPEPEAPGLPPSAGVPASS